MMSKEHSLEPMTGMDMPFSSVATGASVATGSSNTGAFGGVMLKKQIYTSHGSSRNRTAVVSPTASLGKS